MVGDQRKVAAQLDYADEVDAIVPSTTYRLGGRFINNEHRASLELQASGTR